MEGDEIVGVVERLVVVETKRGKVRACVLRVEDENGELSDERRTVWLSRTSLVRIFDEEKIEQSDRIALAYDGKRETSNGTKFHAYRAVVEHARSRTPTDSAEGAPDPGPGHDSDEHMFDRDDPGATDEEIPF